MQPTGLECIKCDSRSDSNCINDPTKSTKCHSAANECYTLLFTGTGTLTRGCVGEKLSVGLPDQPSNFFQKCSEANCNQHKVIVERCKTGEHMSNEPFIRERSIACTQTLAPRGCYHFENPATGTVKKGCVSEFSEAGQAVFATNPQFKVCFGDNCNNQQGVQAAEAGGKLSCIECEAKMYGDCFKDLHRANSCVSPVDECFVMVEPFLSTVRRGCMGKVYPYQIANTSSSELHTCSDMSKCNNVPVQSEYCFSIYYNPATDKHPRPIERLCKPSARPMGCYHTEDTRGRVSKGCISDQHYAGTLRHLVEAPAFHKCSGSLCNSEPTIAKCVSCTQDYSSDSCVSNLKKVETKVCPSYRDKCYTRINEHNRFERGCLSETAREVRENCEVDQSKCLVCSKKQRCNNETMTTEHCYAMEYKQGEEVNIEATHSQRCSPALNASGCYHMETAGTVRKGCVSDMSYHDVGLITKHNFKTCFGRNCNNELALGQRTGDTPPAATGLECIKCDSWSHQDCINDSLKAATCQSPANECYSLYYPGTRGMARGCVGEELSLALPAEPSYFFQKCGDQAKCNQHRVNVERCYRAAHKSGETLDLTPDKSVECEQTIAPIGCFHFDDQISGTVKKGCVNEYSEAERTVVVKNPHFRTCSGDNCNVEHTCLSCSSAAMSADCISDLSHAGSVTCAKLSGPCVIGLDQNGLTHRTCSEMSANDTAKFPLGFATCDGSNCNAFAFPSSRLQCYHCEDCDPKDTSIELSSCTVYSDQDQCFTFRKGMANHHLYIWCIFA